MRKLGPTTIAQVDADYDGRPAHRGHTVEVDGWNSEYVVLLIVSDEKIGEAIVSPAQLRELADAAEREAGKW